MEWRCFRITSFRRKNRNQKGNQQWRSIFAVNRDNCETASSPDDVNTFQGNNSQQITTKIEGNGEVYILEDKEFGL